MDSAVPRWQRASVGCSHGLLGVLQVSGGCHFQASHVSRVLKSNADGISRWDCADVYAKLCVASPHHLLAGIDVRSRGFATVILGVGFAFFRDLLRQRLRELSWDFWAHEGSFGRSWCVCRRFWTRGRWSTEEFSGCCAILRMRILCWVHHVGGSSAGHPIFRRLSGAGELETHHPLIRNAMTGVARRHAAIGTQQRVQRLVPWGVLKAGGRLVPGWGWLVDECRIWLCVRCFFSTRSSELFAVSRSASCRGGVAFFGGGST